MNDMSEEYAERLLKYATNAALTFIPKLGIPLEHQESALKAYVAGFFAGHGAATGESRAKTVRN